MELLQPNTEQRKKFVRFAREVSNLTWANQSMIHGIHFLEKNLAYFNKKYGRSPECCGIAKQSAVLARAKSQAKVNKAFSYAFMMTQNGAAFFADSEKSPDDIDIYANPGFSSEPERQMAQPQEMSDEGLGFWALVIPPLIKGAAVVGTTALIYLGIKEASEAVKHTKNIELELARMNSAIESEIMSMGPTQFKLFSAHKKAMGKIAAKSKDKGFFGEMGAGLGKTLGLIAVVVAGYFAFKAVSERK